jgi:glycosyltransferase involved in cell wall biosynthesis
MTTLNVILDDLISDVPRGNSRYAGELARALIEHAPAGCPVDAIVASSTEQEYRELAKQVPGLHNVFKSALVRRDLTTAWQHGFTPVPTGMLHAPSLLAPLRNHDRVNERGNQIVVTIHDAVAWSHPEFLTSKELSWTKAMAARALKYADAVVVPTHAVADELEEFIAFGDRTRVIAGAPSARLTKPADADARAKRLGLPADYIVTVGDSGQRHGIAYLLGALASKTGDDLRLVVVGAPREADALEGAIAEAGLKADRVVALGSVDDADYATALSKATALVHPTLANGFGSPMLEAFALGVPVIHAGTPSLVEVAGDAGVSIPVADLDAYPGLLAEAIGRVTTDTELRRTLSILGEDRARLFTWRAVAESVWQLHADL